MRQTLPKPTSGLAAPHALHQQQDPIMTPRHLRAIMEKVSNSGKVER